MSDDAAQPADHDQLTLVWFRDDLRVDDHEALTAARTDGQVIGIWIREQRDADGLGPRPLGAAARWWAHESLRALGTELDGLGIPLLFAAGPAADIIPQAAAELGVDAVRWSRRYAPASRALDAKIKTLLTDAGCAAHSNPGALLVEPWTVSPQSGDFYKVFTPFFNAVRDRKVGDVLPVPAKQPPLPEARLAAMDDHDWVSDLDGLGLRDGTGHRNESGTDSGGTDMGTDGTTSARVPQWWKSTVAQHWSPGCREAQRQLQGLGESIDGYGDSHDVPGDPDSTSALSPRLRFGELSPRQALAAALDLPDISDDDRYAWIRQLYWREFSWHLTYHLPHIETEPMRSEFARFPYEDDPEALKHWQNGTTGIPLVDAGMAQLWQAGWMHNRVRMATASFLTKNLLIHWWHGEQWFWDTLVDADEANNPVSWQWVAGCGADAAPYFRIFNPERQRERFDPHGEYVNRWLGQGPGGLTQAERAGEDCEPIVDLKASRQAALAAYDRMKAESD
ncbi:cryptochrome/photolyase family protein [Brevibacterium sp. FAM 25378]|uniref:cryptochrome/photolyase family protein n=1 Tax=unclassified Brevibacterium TaxID=2614124 RepID=UPI001091A568|nr:deoxyribodipyrimidine photo-lyase [Brevibacterium sp. S22]TGD29712.1 deoxyribodipyrimidine photo-lyase [Brevibacterium sp. S22]